MITQSLLDGQRIGVRRRWEPAIAIPAQRPAPAIEQDRAARVEKAVIAFLAQDGRAERLLAQPRCGGCIGCRDACPRCVYVTGLARIAAADWLALPHTARAHRVLPSGASVCGTRLAGTRGWGLADGLPRCEHCAGGAA